MLEAGVNVLLKKSSFGFGKLEEWPTLASQTRPNAVTAAAGTSTMRRAGANDKLNLLVFTENYVAKISIIPSANLTIPKKSG